MKLEALTAEQKETNMKKFVSDLKSKYGKLYSGGFSISEIKIDSIPKEGLRELYRQKAHTIDKKKAIFTNILLRKGDRFGDTIISKEFYETEFLPKAKSRLMNPTKAEFEKAALVVSEFTITDGVLFNRKKMKPSQVPEYFWGHIMSALDTPVISKSYGFTMRMPGNTRLEQTVSFEKANKQTKPKVNPAKQVVDSSRSWNPDSVYPRDSDGRIRGRAD